MDGKGPECKECQKVIVGEPYWRCMACGSMYNVRCGFPRYTDADSATYVCTLCNLRIEAEKSGPLQRAPALERSHGVLHTLVLVTGHLGSSQVELTVEGRIRGMLDQVAEHEKVMSECLESLLKCLSVGAPH